MRHSGEGDRYMAHGTYAGYMTHYRRDVEMCEPCRVAGREYARETLARRRFMNGSQHDPRRCRACGSVFPDHTCGAP